MTVEVYVHPGTVDITFTGLDRWLCLQDRLIIPMDDVVSARVVPIEEARRDLSWRVTCGYWPGVVATGHFAMRNRRGAHQLWCVYRDPEVLMIETTGDRPARVVLQHPDRHNLAWLISERITPA